MHAFTTVASQLMLDLLHRLGIRDRACGDLLVVGLGTAIIFGLLAIVTLKTLLIRAERLERERATARSARTMAARAWRAVRALFVILLLLAASLLIALRLDS